MPNTIQIRDTEGVALYPITHKSIVIDLDAMGASQPVGGMLPDEAYDLGALSGSVTFALAPAVTGNVNHYYWVFSTGGVPPTPTWPAAITIWAGNCIDEDLGTPVLSANKTYEVSVIGGRGVIIEW